MQPESTAVFEHNRSPYPSSENFSFTQDGHDSCGDHRVSGLDHDKAGDSRALPGPSVDQSGLDQPTQTSALVDRVSQYEKAAARTPRNQEGLGFRVVAMSTPSYLSLEDFPNGRSSNRLDTGHGPSANATIDRGSDSHPLSPASAVALIYRTSVPSLAQPGYDTPCMEDCLLPLLSWAKRRRWCAVVCGRSIR